MGSVYFQRRGVTTNGPWQLIAVAAFSMKFSLSMGLVMKRAKRASVLRMDFTGGPPCTRLSHAGDGSARVVGAIHPRCKSQLRVNECTSSAALALSAS